jgi:SH3-like domain-containing protein
MNQQQTKPRAVCLSVSKRNHRVLSLIDDYALEWNTDKASTIFRIVQEYNTYRCLDQIRL